MNNVKPRSHEEHKEDFQKYDFENLSKKIVECAFKVHQKLGSGKTGFLLTLTSRILKRL